MWHPVKTRYRTRYSAHTIRKNILLEGALMKPFNKRNKRLFISTIIGVIFVSAAGTLLHFVYSWTGNNSIIGLFAPVNESTWEHMKLIFFPALFYSLLLFILFRKKYPTLFPACLAGLLCGTLFIPVFFYTYTGILGYHLFWLDIVTFLLAVFLTFFLSFRLFLCQRIRRFFPFLLILSFLFLSAFFYFSFHPPSLGIFSIPQ